MTKADATTSHKSSSTKTQLSKFFTYIVQEKKHSLLVYALYV